MIISSTSNPRIRRARKLKRRADRDATGAFLVESPLTLGVALEAGLEPSETFVSVEADDVAAWCDSIGVETTPVSDHVLRALSDTSAPQGVVAVMPIPHQGEVPPNADLVVVLAEVRDPGNAGTLARSAAAAGADALIFTEGSVDPYSPKTVRSSAGALFGLSIITGVSLEGVAGDLREGGLAVYLAEAGEGPPLFEADLTRPLAFVLGNEARGIDSAGIDGHRVSIPMPGGTESLNVAVAGSILLYEAVRQRVQAQARRAATVSCPSYGEPPIRRDDLEDRA